MIVLTGYLMSETLKFNLLYIVEKKIGPYKVDGFCSELNTVFQFYGDYWHCHPDQFPDENVVHPTVKDKDDNHMTVKDIQ